MTYTHSLVDTHLAIQIDAAINPGNSGGPVLQRGKWWAWPSRAIAGTWRRMSGYMIPVPVIQRFLKDISDGHYDRYMDLSIATFPLQNPAMRRALGLADNEQGIMVSSVASAGCSAGMLKQGDVLMSIDGHPIASDAFVELDGARVQMAEVVERKFKGDDVKLHIIRDRKEMDVAVKLDAAWPYSMQANAYDVVAALRALWRAAFPAVESRTCWRRMRSTTCGCAIFSIPSSRARFTRITRKSS